MTSDFDISTVGVVSLVVCVVSTWLPSLTVGEEERGGGREEERGGGGREESVVVEGLFCCI